MAAKKRTSAPRKAMPTTFRLDQLDEEIRVALNLAKRPGLSRSGEVTPTVHPLRRTVTVGTGDEKRTYEEDVPWTKAQQTTILATMEAHVAGPTFGETVDDKALRAALTNATVPEWAKAMIRKMRGG